MDTHRSPHRRRPSSDRFGRLRAWAVIGVLLAGGACSESGLTNVEDLGLYVYAAPEDIGDGLGGADASTVGLEPTRFREMVRRIQDGFFPNIHSVLVFRSGELVLEEYFEGLMRSDSTVHAFARDTLHDMFSVSKSFTSAAVGLAIASGDITGVDQPVSDFFPDYVHLGGALASGELQVGHLLNMSAGLEWDEGSTPYTDPANSHQQMKDAADPIEFVFSRTQVAAPGTVFAYNTGLTSILGEIVARATGVPFEDYVAQELFEPLGIDQYAWLDYYQGDLAFAGGGLQLRPRDMVKFGLLYMDGGVWQSQQVVPADWVAASTAAQAPEDVGYGYQWWLGTLSLTSGNSTMFRATGLGGQQIYVFPAIDLIVVFTGNGSGAGPFDITNQYILTGLS